MVETIAPATRIDTNGMYLELLKQALSYSLWQEPGVPIGVISRNTSRKSFMRLISRLLDKAGLQLVKKPGSGTDPSLEGNGWSLQAHTMMGLKRLSNIQTCMETALAEGVEGDLIETGVWRGGGCIFMRGVLAAYGITDRRVIVADSFAGLPAADSSLYPADAESFPFHELDFLAVPEEQVRANFRRYDLLDEQVVFLPGWFKDTLPAAPVEKLSLMRLDGDLYQSTMEALTNLYPKLSAGGFCIIDDYAIGPCRQAVEDYRAQMNIREPIRQVDWTGVYWRKEIQARPG